MLSRGTLAFVSAGVLSTYIVCSAQLTAKLSIRILILDVNLAAWDTVKRRPLHAKSVVAGALHHVNISNGRQFACPPCGAEGHTQVVQ